MEAGGGGGVSHAQRELSVRPSVRPSIRPSALLLWPCCKHLHFPAKLTEGVWALDVLDVYAVMLSASLLRQNLKKEKKKKERKNETKKEMSSLRECVCVCLVVS